MVLKIPTHSSILYLLLVPESGCGDCRKQRGLDIFPQPPFLVLLRGTQGILRPSKGGCLQCFHALLRVYFHFDRPGIHSLAGARWRCHLTRQLNHLNWFLLQWRGSAFTLRLAKEEEVNFHCSAEKTQSDCLYLQFSSFILYPKMQSIETFCSAENLSLYSIQFHRCH